MQAIRGCIRVLKEGGAVSAIKSRKARFTCGRCGKERQFSEDLHILGDDKFGEILDWYNWEKEQLIKVAKNADGYAFCDDGIKLFESVRFKRKRKLNGDKISADVNGITVHSDKGNRTFNWRDIDGLATVRRDRVNFYYDGKTYQIRGARGSAR